MLLDWRENTHHTLSLLILLAKIALTYTRFLETCPNQSCSTEQIKSPRQTLKILTLKCFRRIFFLPTKPSQIPHIVTCDFSAAWVMTSKRFSSHSRRTLQHFNFAWISSTSKHIHKQQPYFLFWISTVCFLPWWNFSQGMATCCAAAKQINPGDLYLH